MFGQLSGLKEAAQFAHLLDLAANILRGGQTIHSPAGEQVLQMRADDAAGGWPEENAAGNSHQANGDFCVAPGVEPSVRPKSKPASAKPCLISPANFPAMRGSGGAPPISSTVRRRGPGSSGSVTTPVNDVDAIK